MFYELTIEVHRYQPETNKIEATACQRVNHR